MGTLHLQDILNKIQTCFDLPHYKMDTLLFFTFGQFALTTKIIVKYINCSFIENLGGQQRKWINIHDVTNSFPSVKTENK